MKLMRTKIIGLLLCILLAGSFASYKLTESPQTWFDEGIFLQIARNALTQHPYAIRVSPTELVPAGAVATVGFSVIESIRLSFQVFGIGLLQARIVMVLFILLSTIALYCFAYRAFGFKTALWSTLLFVTHAPVYGNGKNVLGEVPGLFFFFSLIFLLQRLEKKSSISIYPWIFTGFTAGIFMATKPNFLLLLPILLGVLWLRRSQYALTGKQGLSFALSLSIPLMINIYLQFGSWAAFTQSFSNYGMPGLQQVTGLSLPSLILRNISWFFIKATPAYVLLTGSIWLTYIWLRLKQKITIPAHELIALGFVGMTIAYYVKMPGFFRYLFIAQIITFPYFISASIQLFQSYILPRCTLRIQKKSLVVIGTLLVIFQVYQLFFSSWVAGHYQRTRTHELTKFFTTVPTSTHIFVYHAPEIVTFIQGENYSQYFDLLYFKSAIGIQQREKLMNGASDIVIISHDSVEQAQPYLEKYRLKQTIDHEDYFVFERI